MEPEQIDSNSPAPESAGSESSTPRSSVSKVILLVAGLLIVWVGVSVYQTQTDKPGTFTDLDYEQAIAAELSDKCATPESYTDEDWVAHMSHHPNRYAECLGKETASAAYQNISPDELDALLAADATDEKIALIDTHIPEQAHILGTDAFVPFNEITDNLGDLPQDKSAPIVLYCRSGNMSAKASKELVDLGYSNVYNLEGGTNAWLASGRDVIAEKL